MKALRNRLSKVLLEHYLCIQMKMMLLTPLDDQIATPNHVFSQNGVFFEV